MLTAVDTSVLLDVFGADPTFGRRSREALRACIDRGRLVACDIVWAEVAASFPNPREARVAMDRVGLDFSAVGPEAAVAAGAAWRRYRERGGGRQWLIPDFLIAAHARAQADQLLTRDRGFYRGCFEDLEVIDPSHDRPT